jgi:membrane peptidoglycan carboxypeptidase
MLASLLRVIATVLLGEEWRLLRSTITQQLQGVSRRPLHVPPIVAKFLLVSGEDHRHGRHPGYDLIAIMRALWRRTNGVREGASTIEQQIVRVLTGRYERTLLRKAREILLATLVAHHFPKAALPGLYLRIGYYGWHMNGFSQACARLKINPASMSLHEAAAVVARLKYPEPRSCSTMRRVQIEGRTRHLLNLYHCHLDQGVYDHLQTVPALATIPAGRLVPATARAVS